MSAAMSDHANTPDEFCLELHTALGAVSRALEMMDEDAQHQFSALYDDLEDARLTLLTYLDSIYGA